MLGFSEIARGVAYAVKACEVERISQETRISLENYWKVSVKVFDASTAKVNCKCKSCGSLDFVKHHSNTICSYCRTPNHVR